MKLIKTLYNNYYHTIFCQAMLSAQDHKPYILAATSDASISEVSIIVKNKLTESGLSVIGEYSPAKDSNRKVLIVTSDELKNAVKSIGGLTGFASALRVALTSENGKINISYTNPIYWGNAYFGDDYHKVQPNYLAVTKKD